MDNGSARSTSAALGVWLRISTALWHHSHIHLVNTLVVAFIVVGSSAIAFKSPGVRMVTAAAGVWLIASLFAWTPSAALTTWHDFMVGAAIVLVSAVGPRREETPPSSRSLRSSH